MGWCRVTLERAAPGDIYPSYATEKPTSYEQVKTLDKISVICLF